ncbi:unnamed protein product [Dracunculus medinensis]|uniref:Retrotransposon gag protein n=1 Tax=Dracunculus medinensis TaxID=318479 RepID=A0A0N4UQP5_DRAME|nr:unnamed protein product [Dracunculus medinensis]
MTEPSEPPNLNEQVDFIEFIRSTMKSTEKSPSKGQPTVNNKNHTVKGKPNVSLKQSLNKTSTQLPSQKVPCQSDSRKWQTTIFHSLDVEESFINPITVCSISEDLLQMPSLERVSIPNEINIQSQTRTVLIYSLPSSISHQFMAFTVFIVTRQFNFQYLMSDIPGPRIISYISDILYHFYYVSIVIEDFKPFYGLI